MIQGVQNEKGNSRRYVGVMKKGLPVGVSEFRDMIMDNGYYVDKTMLIADWLQTVRENVTSITRYR